MKSLKLTPVSLLLLASNEAFPEYRGDRTVNGGLFAANESEFDSNFYDQQLTNYLVGGWDQDPIEEILGFFAPAVETEDSVDYKEFLHADEFIADDDDSDIRALNADMGIIPSDTLNNKNVKVPHKGFKIILDKKTRPEVVRRKLRSARRRLKRNEIRRTIALVDAAATVSNLVWDGTSDPDADIRGLLTLSENSSGLRPTRVAYGSLAWDRRDKAVRAQDNAGANSSVNWTPERLAQYLMVTALSWGEVRYREAANALANYLGDSVYMFNAAEGLTEEDPSNIKRFVTSQEGGLDVAVYADTSHPLLDVYYVAHHSIPVLTSPLGIRKAVTSDS